jgi:hypothetical protein
MTTRIAALTALVALAVVPTASAQLPQGDTEGVQKGSSAVTGVPSALEGSVEAGSRCRTVWAGRYRKNALQIVVWRYRQEIFFCYKPNRATGGGRITYLSRTRWGRTYLAVWTFRGHIGNATSWNARWSYRAFSQGHFEYCPGVWLCVASREPWVRMTVYGSGSWTWKTG